MTAHFLAEAPPGLWQQNPVILKICNVVFAFAFVLATLVQYNDPDPYLWMGIYLTAVACCCAFALGKLPPIAGYVVAAAAVLWSLTLIPTVMSHPPRLADVFGDVKMYAPGVEEAREAGGLWLVAGWVLTLARASERLRQAGASSEPG